MNIQLNFYNKLEGEITLLMKKAKEANGHDFDSLDIPEEIKRRKDRLAEIKVAKAEIENRRQARYNEEKAEYDAKIAKEEARGRKLGERKPTEPTPEPKASDQVNLTDEES